jgi:hypothetical protein
MPSADNVLKLHPAVAFRILGDEALLCNTQSGLAHVVNRSAAQVLLEYQTGSSVPDAISRLAHQFAVTEGAIGDSVREVTDHMLELRLLVRLDEPTPLSPSSHANASTSGSKSHAVPRYLLDPPSQ